MSKAHKHLSLVLAVLAAAALSAQVMAQEIVAYDKSANPRGNDYYASAAEFGDQIKLTQGLPDGTRFPITLFQFEYTTKGFSGEKGNLTVRFYDLDAELIIGGKKYAAPNADVSKAFFTASGPIKAGSQRVDIPFGLDSSVSVPKEFVWTVSFSGLDAGEEAGLLLYGDDPSDVGSSLADFWKREADSWSLATLDNGNIPANFGARVTVIPEPSTFVLALLAGGGILAFRRRS